jgi:TfoX/Sxy family transcriptional regulator of competence genes
MGFRALRSIDESRKMATEAGFAEFVHKQSQLGPRLKYRKMFGEFGFHLDGKFVAVACDNMFFVKPTDALKKIAPKLPSKSPYEGAKPYAVADGLLDKPTQLKRLLIETAARLPDPKPRKSTKSKSKRGSRKGV